MVQVAAAGVCHSDLSAVNGIGHGQCQWSWGMGAGVVVEVGALVKDISIGDQCLIFMPNCGDCLQCRSGKPSNCEQGNAANAAGRLLSGERRIALNGER